MLVYLSFIRREKIQYRGKQFIRLNQDEYNSLMKIPVTYRQYATYKGSDTDEFPLDMPVTIQVLPDDTVAPGCETIVSTHDIYATMIIFYNEYCDGVMDELIRKADKLKIEEVRVRYSRSWRTDDNPTTENYDQPRFIERRSKLEQDIRDTLRDFKDIRITREEIEKLLIPWTYRSESGYTRELPGHDDLLLLLLRHSYGAATWKDIFIIGGYSLIYSVPNIDFNRYYEDEGVSGSFIIDIIRSIDYSEEAKYDYIEYMLENGADPNIYHYHIDPCYHIFEELSIALDSNCISRRIVELLFDYGLLTDLKEILKDNNEEEYEGYYRCNVLFCDSHITYWNLMRDGCGDKIDEIDAKILEMTNDERKEYILSLFPSYYEIEGKDYGSDDL